MNALLITLLIVTIYLFYRARPWKHGIEKFFRILSVGILAAMGLNLIIYLAGYWFDLDRDWTDPLSIFVLATGIGVAAFLGTLQKDVSNLRKKSISGKN